MLSKQVSRTIFWIFAMNRPGNEPRVSGPLANTLLPLRVTLDYGRQLYLYIYIYIYIWGTLNKFLDFFRMALLLIVHTWNSSSFRSNLLRLQCACCTVPTTSGRPHGRPLLWACQWPFSQPLSYRQLPHKDSFWA